MKHPTNKGSILMLRFVGVIAVVLLHCAAVAEKLEKGDSQVQEMRSRWYH
ncbi:MAG: hypothetical protein RLZZ396_1878 [Planctomycetota bacterium]|jgi:hypothetical protein